MSAPARDLFGETRRPDPPVNRCETCGGFAVYGVGPPMVPSPRWWCAGCAPREFFNFQRVA